MAQDQCTFHTSKPAVWQCEECVKNYCDSCVVTIGETANAQGVRCPLCENWLTFLGTGHTASPFWTMAPTFFGYPLKGSAIGLIVLTGLLGALIGSGFFALPVFIFACAVIARYGVAVLSCVAQGESAAPSLWDAIERDDDHIFLKFCALLISFVGLQLVVTVLVSPTLGTVSSIVLAILAPAMIIFLGMERTLGSVFSPLRLFWLISRIGWPYVLVIFISNVLTSGPMLVLANLGEGFSGPVVMAILVSSFAYFGIVNFALLGYVIFEKQGDLGYVAGSIEDVEVTNTPMNRLARLLGEINVLVKEGRQADALKRVDQARMEFRDEPRFYERAVLLAISTKNVPLIESLTNGYLQLLMSKDALDPALDICRKSMLAHRNFRPDSPDIAHALAERAYSKNLNKDALHLLVNLHKRAPAYPHLGDAYRLAAEILRKGFDNEAKAAELEAFVTAKGYS